MHKNKRWWQSHSFITWKIKTKQLNTILLLRRILLTKQEPLPRWKSASCSKDGMSPLSLGESYFFIPSSSSSCFSAVFLLLLEVRAFEADQFDRLNFSLIEEREGSSSSCHRCFLFDRALKHCCDKCLRSVSPLRYAMWCHRYRW